MTEARMLLSDTRLSARDCTGEDMKSKLSVINSKLSAVKPGFGPFNEVDYLVVRRAMDDLPLLEKLAVELRFFHNFSIEEISRFLRIGWDEASSMLDESLLILKSKCLSDPEFSRRRIKLQAA
jgi:hypothetical protein